LSRLAEMGERLMNIRNQSADLVSSNLTTAHICSHDFRGEFTIGRYDRLVFRHPDSSLFPNDSITDQVAALTFKY